MSLNKCYEYLSKCTACTHIYMYLTFGRDFSGMRSLGILLLDIKSEPTTSDAMQRIYFYYYKINWRRRKAVFKEK